jgi:hypothetical protein
LKEWENPIESKDLKTINFIGYMHNMTWAMEKQEAQWAGKKKVHSYG